jgi:putative nucleotidyltransferase with HDIG domain
MLLLWWTAGMLGVLSVGSLILTGLGAWETCRKDPDHGMLRCLRPVGIALLIAIPFAVWAWFVFAPATGTPWKFSLIPGYIGAGMAGGPLGAAIGLFCIAMAGIAAMAEGSARAVLATPDAVTSVLQAQMSFVFGGISALALAGVIAENRRNAANAEVAVSQFRELFDTMREGVAYCRMIYDDDGSPVDWVYLQVNEAFGHLTGLHDVVGRHVWEVMPTLDETNSDLFEIYGEVASTGIPALFESHIAPIGRTMRISVTSPGTGEFIAVFEDVTGRVTQERELAESNERLERMVYDVAAAMGSVVESRDPYTQGHEVRVASLGKRIAREMGLSDDALDEISMVGLLHDIGKLRVPAEILTKPGQLSDAEFALIKEHPDQGFEILSHIEFPWPVAEIARQHHERLDGSGYPRGLKAEEIMLPARILAVADVVEAMASHRPYRPAVGLDEAIQEVSSHPELYDDQVVTACVRLYERGDTGL